MKTSSAWFGFIGIFILLIGLFAALHTLYNISLPKYPQFGVLFINTSGFVPSAQRESDCIYNQVYYAEDGMTLRDPNAGEKRQMELDRTRCLESVASAREDAKMQDISASICLLFIGAGLLISRRFLYK